MKSCQKYINTSISGGEAINEIVLLWVILYPDHLLRDYPLKKQAYWEVMLCYWESCVKQLTTGTATLIASICRSGKDTDVPKPSKDRGWCYRVMRCYTVEKMIGHITPLAVQENQRAMQYFQNHFGSGFVKVCFVFFGLLKQVGSSLVNSRLS